jgi:hypothetical protein
MKQLAFASAAALILAACGDGEGTSVSINATSSKGEGVAVDADGKTGNVAVKVPGFAANMKMPRIMLDSANFDIDGVKLYPESKVRSLNILADDAKGGDSANVQVQFDAPATPDEVRDWFAKAFADKSVSTSLDGTGLKGKTKDGDAFTIRLAPAGAGSTQGTIEIIA